MDIEFVKKELQHFQQEEIASVARVAKAEEMLKAAKAELAEAKETLKGDRGCIAELTWQIEFYEEHGRLP